MVQLSALISFVFLAASLTFAHPAAHMSQGELARRAEFHRATRRSLGQCQDQLRRRGHFEKSAARRAALADELRKKRGLATRSPYKRALTLDEVLATSHESNTTGLTADSDPFDGNASCVLAPEVTQGPYYVDGEYVRSNITEDQEGVYTYVDVELIDVSTCEPVSDVYIDFWHCNATGVYAGVIASGNGNSNDATNVNKTFLRGIQPTNDEGYAQFETIFPGHYTSRANHIHIIAHGNGTLFDNGTFKADSDHHVGKPRQFFFDQDLITVVEATSPYTSNTQQLTTNANDSILAQEVEDATDGIDPVLEYVYLGDDVSDGLLAWGSMAIDLSSSYTTSAAATLTEDGGVMSDTSSSGGTGSGNGTASF
ncbi:extracellular dioxygenase-like protein [Guyanagaster necrorhizus]|uniref:Extracellular dioxygenase-like protein n=1 Tax=Guyanagaster necrorhizus TaxID=856835 RepID=A0A9P7VLR5_9AGAR|nr:extracellular dioxygenase-like protein [Guyanagaster necrorhizus MCA 3950]KAG7443503.1 extracellular dioxygenase-like protein [Guyanagaster necrorhizus MCA 3950]